MFVGQEIGFSDSSKDDFTAWAGRRGWTCLSSPGLQTKGATPAQGFVILALDHVGFRGPDCECAVIHPRRAVRAIDVDTPSKQKQVDWEQRLRKRP